jgi:hypothetical protein
MKKIFNKIYYNIHHPNKITLLVAIITSLLLLGVNFTIMAAFLSWLFGTIGAFCYKSYEKMEIGQNLPKYFATFTFEKFCLYFIGCLALSFPGKFLPILIGL